VVQNAVQQASAHPRKDWQDSTQGIADCEVVPTVQQ
jgi:hypothetical protein